MKRRPRRRLLRRADLHNVPVLDMRESGDAMVLTVGLTDSHAILIRVGSQDAVRDLGHETADEIAVPLVVQDGRPALVLRIDDPPAGLAVGAQIDLQVKFVADLAFDLPVVEAVACRVSVRRPPRRAATITLPSIGMPA